MKSITHYIREKAEQMRQRADNPRKTPSEDQRDRWAFSARQMDILADDIDNEFHIRDEEE